MAANLRVDDVLESLFSVEKMGEFSDFSSDEDEDGQNENRQDAGAVGIALILRISTISAAEILSNESKLWLDRIYRRLASKRSVRQPFYAEIRRDIPLGIFKALVRAIKDANIPELQEPNCYIAGNQWRSQPDNLVMLCKFEVIIIIHFFRNSLFSRSMNTEIFA